MGDNVAYFTWGGIVVLLLLIAKEYFWPSFKRFCPWGDKIPKGTEGTDTYFCSCGGALSEAEYLRHKTFGHDAGINSGTENQYIPPNAQPTWDFTGVIPSDDEIEKQLNIYKDKYPNVYGEVTVEKVKEWYRKDLGPFSNTTPLEQVRQQAGICSRKTSHEGPCNGSPRQSCPGYSSWLGQQTCPGCIASRSGLGRCKVHEPMALQESKKGLFITCGFCEELLDASKLPEEIPKGAIFFCDDVCRRNYGKRQYSSDICGND